MTTLGSFSATDAATEHIRERIISDELPAGTKIKIDELAVELGMSRTPVRDALTRLQSEGLVRIVSRVGVYVREITPEEVLEVYTLKESLEPVMARWATERSSEEERQAFYDSAADLPRIAAQGDSAAYIELVVKRRLRMLELARSEVLSGIMRQIDERVRILRNRNLSQLERLEASHREHQAIAEAVRDGDAERAGELMGDHVRSARTSLIALIEHGTFGSTSP
ncbi:GntR family transcriptional regulator [Nocardioides humi]|uniref:GntR family transcriptional regulator n=1 Tax=Nocardioides humi TaxID=449461 RepID=A0ABN2AA13_9ACTN|nr:GntR family transcriptional regulator [Nocardioides humi]